MKTLRIPLVGSITDRKVNAFPHDTADQVFINCFPDVVKNNITGKDSVWLTKRQGTTASADVQASATGQYGAVLRSNGSAVFSYRKTGNTSSMFFSSVGAQVGADVANTGGCVFMNTTDVSGVENLTATLVESGNVYEAWYYPNGGSWTEITDSDFPKSTLTPTHTHMDGYMFVMTSTGRIHHSDLNSVASWNAANYITANSFGDGGVGVARYKEYIVGFGGVTTEFFVNTGNATGSILSRAADLTVNIGALATSPAVGTSIRELGDSVYWIGKHADTGKKGIYRLNGPKPEKISNTAIDRMLHTAVLAHVLGSFSLYGYTFVAFSLFLNTTAVCYCVETGFWWYLTPAGNLSLTAMAAEATDTATDSFFITSSNAKIYNFDSIAPVWQDNGSDYKMTVRTQPLDLGTRKKKIWTGVSVIGDTQTSTCNIGISYSDDDYATSTAARNIDMSSMASNRLTRWGTSRRRAWQFENSSNTPNRIEAVEFEYEVGLS